MMTLLQLSRIDKSIDIEAPPERVWSALTSARELSEWFQVTIEGVIAPGSELWMTSTHTGYAGQRFRVRITEMTPGRRLIWQWHPGEVDPAVDYSREPMTTVTFTLEPDGAGTRLTVSESGFDEVALARRAKVYGDNEKGWTQVLVSLKDHVEARR
jgi:uncharacterized protein YndB with AHSA1/START domain